jgi:putative transposase
VKAAYRGVLEDLTSPQEGYAVSNDNVTKLIQPGAFDDPLTEILRNGARALLAQAVEAEVAEFLAKHADLKTDDGHARIVRHGHLPEREVMTGLPFPVNNEFGWADSISLANAVAAL